MRLIAVDNAPEPMWPKLAPDQQATVVMALAGLLLLAGFVLLVVFWGGRLARRAARRRLPPAPHREDDWYAKPLIEGEGEVDARRDAED